MFNLTNLCGFMAYTDAVSGGTGAGPGGGDPYWSDVVWYFRFDDDLVDQKGNLTATSVSTVFASDGPYGLGEKCLETSHTYAYPSYVYASAGVVDIGAGDFTIELWAKMDPFHPVDHWLYEAAASSGKQISYIKDGLNFGFQFMAGRINTAEVTNEAWHWLVFQRESGTISMWIDGVKEAGTLVDSMDLDGFFTGRAGAADPGMYIRIAEHRGTKRARYSSATIPVPTAPFPNS